MQSLKAVAVASLLVAVAAALTCFESQYGEDVSDRCEGPVCFYEKERRDGMFGVDNAAWDTTSGCKEDTDWCTAHGVPVNDCEKTDYTEYCCCQSYHDCKSYWFRTEYMAEPPPTMPTTSTAAATTNSTTAPFVCSENKDAYQGLVCPSRLCYRLLSGDGGGALLDYGCADRVDQHEAPPAEVVVAVCSGKRRYCFDSTGVNKAAVRVCCCDSAGCNRESLGALPPAAATAPTVALVPLAVALAAHLL